MGHHDKIHWTPSMDMKLKQYWKENLPIGEIAQKINSSQVKASNIAYRASVLCLPVRKLCRDGIVYNDVWDEPTVKDLISLWQEGHSARDIAMRLGNGISRNAVIGKAHRLGLSQRHGKKHKRDLLVGSLKDIQECQFPQGDPGTDGFRYCGSKDLIEGQPYCADCCDIAYTSLDGNSE